MIQSLGQANTINKYNSIGKNGKNDMPVDKEKVELGGSHDDSEMQKADELREKHRSSIMDNLKEEINEDELVLKYTKGDKKLIMGEQLRVTRSQELGLEDFPEVMLLSGTGMLGGGFSGAILAGILGASGLGVVGALLGGAILGGIGGFLKVKEHHSHKYTI